MANIMEIMWIQFHRDDSLFDIWCANRPLMFKPVPDNHISLYCMIEDDVLICKIRSPNQPNIPELVYPLLTNYESIKWYNSDSPADGYTLPSLTYFEITNPSEIVQFKLTYS